jgi:hypothetical protein
MENALRQMTEAESKQMAIIAHKSLYKDKYRNALKSLSKIKVYEYYETHPNSSAKEVLVNVINGYNPNLPSAVLLEMTQFILNEWEAIKNVKNEMALA